jgi:hypothetical protein
MFKLFQFAAIAMISMISFTIQAEPLQDFHRLIITNPNNQILVVKIKDTDFWVTPGVYQNGDASAKLVESAQSYGLDIQNLELKGNFELINETTGKQGKRLFYTASIAAFPQQNSMPDFITEVRWLSPFDAINLMTFPHISILLSQILTSPETVWTGTIKRFQLDGEYKAEMTGPFQPLTP